MNISVIEDEPHKIVFLTFMLKISGINLKNYPRVVCSMLSFLYSSILVRSGKKTWTIQTPSWQELHPTIACMPSQMNGKAPRYFVSFISSPGAVIMLSTGASHQHPNQRTTRNNTYIHSLDW